MSFVASVCIKPYLFQ